MRVRRRGRNAANRSAAACVSACRPQRRAALMAQRKKKHAPIRLASTPNMRRGVFPLGRGRFMTVAFPKELDTADKYAVATALAKVAQELVAAADAENAALSPVQVGDVVTKEGELL